MQWGTPATTQIKDCIVHTVPFPGSGPLLNFILNLINENITSNHELLWHRIIEAFKHGFGLRTCICNGEYAPVFKEVDNRQIIDKHRCEYTISIFLVILSDVLEGFRSRNFSQNQR